jgi:hypothetical protein
MREAASILAAFPRRRLGFFPTPLVEMERLGKLLRGPRIFIKRDDQTGLAMGGITHPATDSVPWLKLPGE